jgi:tRNA-uridine 2-sulfurtransferase
MEAVFMSGDKGRAVIAMSGGVDSSVAAALLREQGWEVIGITLRLWEEEHAGETPVPSRSCCAWEAVNDARQVAAVLGIDHYVLNMKEQFKSGVVDYFVDEYRCGRTPNPCIACNRLIKFSALLQKAKEVGASYLATGHYVRLEYDAARKRFCLRKGIDAWKDQSYMLYELTQDQLQHCLFPLGELTKEQVRRKAASLGLGVARKQESQEICFIPDNDYRGFLRRYGLQAGPGPIINSRGETLGTHEGFPFYTIGQRKGLGLTAARPLYVLEIRPDDNLLVVGEREELCRAGLDVEALNLIAIPSLEQEQLVTVKIRYRSAAVPAVLRPLPAEDTARILFTQPQPSVTPGQAAVFYQDDLVLGGGTISAALPVHPE